MRVFLRRPRKAVDFAEVLESLFRSAGRDFGRRDAAPRVADSVTANLEQPEERPKAWAPPLSIVRYLELREAALLARTVKPTDPQSIARELAINARMSFSDLNSLRRRFALANHPDRVPECDRDNATRRMMVANMLIDHALQSRFSR